MSKLTAEQLISGTYRVNGGAGSGDFDHAGRPREQGESASDSKVGGDKSKRTIDKAASALSQKGLTLGAPKSETGADGKWEIRYFVKPPMDPPR